MINTLRLTWKKERISLKLGICRMYGKSSIAITINTSGCWPAPFPWALEQLPQGCPGALLTAFPRPLQVSTGCLHFWLASSFLRSWKCQYFSPVKMWGTSIACTLWLLHFSWHWNRACQLPRYSGGGTLFWGLPHDSNGPLFWGLPHHSNGPLFWGLCCLFPVIHPTGRYQRRSNNLLGSLSPIGLGQDLLCSAFLIQPVAFLCFALDTLGCASSVSWSRDSFLEKKNISPEGGGQTYDPFWGSYPTTLMR